jgi:hypothetical protein
MDIKIVDNVEPEHWRRYVANHPEGNIFHTPEMFEVFSRTQNHRPLLWAAVDIRQELQALLLPVNITLMNGWLRKLSARAVAYGGVLCDSNSEGKEALRLLLERYKSEARKSVLFTELRNLSNFESMQPILNEQNFYYEDHLNYLIDLERPPEAIFQHIGRRTRKNIRRALKKGEVTVKEAREPEQTEICYNLLRRTYSRARVPLPDRSLFEAAFEILYPKRMIRFTIAFVGKTPAAASMELLYKDTIYGWYGGVDRTFSSYMPNELLMWHILRWGSENGYGLYDFGGAGKPDEEYGVRDFKAKFGGEKVCFGRNICVHRPVLTRLVEVGYGIYRRVL